MSLDPDDAMDVKRGDEAIDQGLAYQLEQCRYALLQRDEQLRKALQELSEERQQSADLCNQRTDLKQQLAQAQAQCSDSWSEGKPCYFCNEPVANLSANPSFWPLIFCHADDPGVPKAHHIGCVTKRLNEEAKLQAQLQEAVELLLKSSPRDFSDAAARLQWVQQRDSFLARQKGDKP